MDLDVFHNYLMQGSSMRFVMVTVKEKDVMINVDKLIYFTNNEGFVTINLDTVGTVITQTPYDFFIMSLHEVSRTLP